MQQAEEQATLVVLQNPSAKTLARISAVESAQSVAAVAEQQARPNRREAQSQRALRRLRKVLVNRRKSSAEKKVSDTNTGYADIPVLVSDTFFSLRCNFPAICDKEPGLLFANIMLGGGGRYFFAFALLARWIN